MHLTMSLRPFVSLSVQALLVEPFDLWEQQKAITEKIGVKGGHYRTIRILNFYRLCRIGYGYIDYFLIRIRDLYGFIIGPWVPKNPFKSV